MSTLAQLDRRLSRKIETGKGIQLTPDDLDLLVGAGAIDVFRQAVAENQRKQCLERSARNRSIQGENSHSIHEKDVTPKSSGTILRESASEAGARVQAILSKRS